MLTNLFKIIVKTLNGKQLPVEIASEWSVKQIKDQIEKEHDMKADSLKLIAYGKVLEPDEKLASDFSLKEGDFIVAMVQKPKPVPKPKEEVKKDDKPVSAPVVVPTAQVSQPQPSQAQSQAQSNQASSSQNLSPEVQSALTELMSISGKPRELCLQALAAAQNIPDVAFEFLMSGMIPQIDGDGDEDDGGYGDEEMDGDGGDVGGLGNYNLDPSVQQAINALVNNPSFPMIRQRMIQDPNFSAQFMQQLQQTQPQIFNAIQQNPGILMSLILGHDPMAGIAHHGQQHQQQPPPGSIQVTPEEMESINRLVSFGFSKARAAEAFFACDKNEEMAANFLFEAGAEDEDVATQNAIAASQQLAQQQQNPPADQQNQPSNPSNQNNESKPDDKKDDEPDMSGGAGQGGSSLL